MSHVWDSLVLGGVDKPRILICGSNFCFNPYFNENTDGWTKGTNGTATRVSDINSIGEYLLNLTFTGSGQSYIEYSYDTSEPILNKKFIAAIRIKSKYAFKIQLLGASLLNEITVQPSDIINNIFIIAEGTGSGNIIKLKIIGTDNVDIKFDNLYLTIISDDYIFPQPNESKILFEKNNLGENQLWNGKIQQFNFKFLPIFYCSWNYLSAIYESFRQKISFNQQLFCIPHMDVNWGFFGIWVDDFERKYSFDRFFGHNSDISIKGSEFIYELPSLQSGTGSLYIDDDLIK